MRHFAAAGDPDLAKPSAVVPTAQVRSDEPLDELSDEAQTALESLRLQLAADSEARVMLDDIVRGRRLGPDDGWFRVAHAQSRFDWASVAARYDRDANGTIERVEFPGGNDDFERLDRNRDALLTTEDLSWKEHALAKSPGAILFRLADQDGNGKVTPEEFAQLFRQLDTDSAGFVSLDEVREQLQVPSDTKQDSRPDRSTLILGLARQEVGSLQPGPALDEKAPDFTLTSLEGTRVTLSSEIGQQPVVLIFGNFTCGPFRSHAGNLEKLYQRYRERAKFFLIYVREAHPSDGWSSPHNRQIGIDLTQPKSDEQRCAVAGRCQQHLKLNLPFLVDTVADTVGTAYSGMPNRFYLIDQEGRVAFKSGRGPFGFKPGELEQALIWLLHEPRSGNASSTALSQ
ncbi:MAG: deiodinase family protein [Pirellulaceae bacterium]